MLATPLTCFAREHQPLRNSRQPIIRTTAPDRGSLPPRHRLLNPTCTRNSVPPHENSYSRVIGGSRRLLHGKGPRSHRHGRQFQQVDGQVVPAEHLVTHAGPHVLVKIVALGSILSYHLRSHRSTVYEHSVAITNLVVGSIAAPSPQDPAPAALPSSKRHHRKTLGRGEQSKERSSRRPLPPHAPQNARPEVEQGTSPAG